MLRAFTIPLFERVKNHAHCIFEYIYFSRPDSFAFGHNVDKIRRKFGRQLAIEHPCKGADVVIGIPDSATTAALGYSEESGIRFDIGLIRNHYVGRTFIHPVQAGRDINVRIKFNPVKGVIKGQEDRACRRLHRARHDHEKDREPHQDRGTGRDPPAHFVAAHHLPVLLRHRHADQRGAHCLGKRVEEIRKYLGVDSLGYLSIEGKFSVLKPEQRPNFCTACFNGNYFVKPVE